MINLSVVIIARNEVEDLPDCLKSVKWVGEVIVVDNGSTDQTAKIAKSFGAKVFEYEKEASEGYFSEIRNFAASKAKGKWLLYIDADERLTEELSSEIKSILEYEPDDSKDETHPEQVKRVEGSSKDANVAFAIPRRNILLGREMRHGGWSPDYVLRLIKKDALLGYEGKLHEQPKIRGQVSKLKNPLTHITHKNLTEMVEKTNKWSEIEAKLLFDSGHPKMNIFRFFTAGLREFWYRAIRKLGLLDGTVGWIEIMYQTYSRLITYAKLWELQLRTQNSKVKVQNHSKNLET